MDRWIYDVFLAHFFCRQKTAYVISACRVRSKRCIGDSSQGVGGEGQELAVVGYRQEYGFAHRTKVVYCGSSQR